MKFTIRYYSILFFLTFTSSSFAQYKPGLVNSNYVGTAGLNFNPSMISNSRYKYNINLLGSDISIVNNLVKWEGPYPLPIVFVRDVLPTSLQKNIFADYYNAAEDKVQINFDYDGVSFVRVKNPHKALSNATMELNNELLSGIFEIPKLDAMGAINLRWRNQIDMRNVNSALSILAMSGFESSYTQNLASLPSIKGMNANIGAYSYLDLGFTVAKKIYEDDLGMWNVGLTAKYLGGMFNMNMGMENAEISFSTVPNKTNADTHELINILAIDKAHLYVIDETKFHNKLDRMVEKQRPYNIFNPFYFLGAIKGHGIGTDFGVNYEYIDPDHDLTRGKFNSRRYKFLEKTQNRYIFKAGFSISDLGFIRYGGNDQTTKYFVVDTTTAALPAKIDIHNFAAFSFKKSSEPAANNWFENAANLTNETFIDEAYNVGLPTRANFNFDYKYRDNLYIGGVWVQNLSFLKKGISMQAPSLLAVVPRYERKYFEVGMPIILTNHYKNVQMGLNLRTGPLSVGTDHLLSMFFGPNVQGTSLYFNLNLPIYHKAILKTAEEIDFNDDRGLLTRIREELRKRHLHKLHKKAMKEG